MRAGLEPNFGIHATHHAEKQAFSPFRDSSLVPIAYLLA
jgi:hypothetical protein